MSVNKSDGLYTKYFVQRTDGRDSIGHDREDAVYFVLDIKYDKHARYALRCYMHACAEDNPVLAQDLLELLKEHAKD